MFYVYLLSEVWQNWREPHTNWCLLLIYVVQAPSSRHDSYYGSSRHDPPPPPSYSASYSDRRLSSERHPSSSQFSRRDDFRRPSGPPKRGSYRGRLSSRGSRGMRMSERPMRRRLVESSYVVRKRVIPRVADFQRRLKISRMRR